MSGEHEGPNGFDRLAEPVAGTGARVAPMDWDDLAKKTPPERRWAIQGWLGFDHVTLLVGAGGIGKTLIAQQIASCLALAKPQFIDEFHYQRTCLMWACEDDHNELWRRQVKIAQWQGVGLEEYSGQLVIEPRAGLDNCLLSVDFTKPMWTPLIQELSQQAQDYDSQVVILDNVAQLYGGNENDRHSVTMFLNGLVGALPGRAILLLAHPSRGASSEFSGSSAWENCVRTRLYLGDKLPDAKSGEGETQDDIRFLSRRKANYSSKDYRRLQFNNGVLTHDPIEQYSPLIEGIRAKKAPKVLIDAAKVLRDLNVPFTDGVTSPRFLPRTIIEYKLGQGCTKAELTEAMRQAIIDGILTKKQVGQTQSRHPLFGLEIAEKQPALTSK